VITTARRLQQSLPPDRYVTVIPLKEPETHPLVARLARLRRGLGPTLAGTFDRQREKEPPMTKTDQRYVERLVKHMTKPKPGSRKRDDDDEDDDEDENDED